MSKTRNRWWISDLHLGHQKCWEEFKQPDGVTPLRPFSSTEEMDQTIIDNWNRVVGDDDRVYVLGDCVINRRFLYKLGHLRGKKTLVRGNHDIFETSEYLEHFDEVHGVLVYDKIVATHIPIHVDSLARFKGNVHGHLHAYVVERTTGQGKRVVDTRYVNVAVEQVNYTPLHHDELLKRFKDQP